MKCKFIGDVGVDLACMTESEKAKVSWRPVIDRLTRKQKLEPYFEAGTEYEHPNAAHFVERGVAVPADDECQAACSHLSEAQLLKLQQEYAADAAGIADKDDRELFFAKVIKGYEVVDGQSAYVPGENWAKYKAAQDKIKKQAANGI